MQSFLMTKCLIKSFNYLFCAMKLLKDHQNTLEHLCTSLSLQLKPKFQSYFSSKIIDLLKEQIVVWT